MISTECDHIAPKCYAETIDFLEEEIGTILRSCNCDISTISEEKIRKISLNTEKLIKEYDAYIDWCIEHNPFALSEIRDFRFSRDFWIKFKSEQLGSYCQEEL